MKSLSPLVLLAAFFLVSCEIDEPPRRTTRTAATRPAPATQYPPPTQPFDPNASTTTTTTTTTPPIDPADTTAAASTPPTTTTSTTQARGDYPYGVPVPDKPGFVRSPYSPDKLTDVRGYAPGTEVKDPYTGKIFLVP